jgi:hypothetical protein
MTFSRFEANNGLFLKHLVLRLDEINACLNNSIMLTPQGISMIRVGRKAEKAGELS